MILIMQTLDRKSYLLEVSLVTSYKISIVSRYSWAVQFKLCELFTISHQQTIYWCFYYLCLHFTGRYQIWLFHWNSYALLKCYGDSRYRFEFHKRLPNKADKVVVSNTWAFLPVTFQDEGYYCCRMYDKQKLVGATCFKVVVLGKQCFCAYNNVSCEYYC